MLYGLVAFFLLLPAVFGWERPGGLPRMVLRNRVLRVARAVSYGIFLWHLPVMGELSLGRINEFWGSSRMLGITAAGLLIAVACATVSYYALERPVFASSTGEHERIELLRALQRLASGGVVAVRDQHVGEHSPREI